MNTIKSKLHIAALILLSFIPKLSHAQNIEWNKTYGGSAADIAYSVKQTPDGGYIVAGSTASNNGDVAGLQKGETDFMVLKLNADGSIAWKKTFGGTGPEEAKSISPTSDGGYIVAGYTYSNNGDATGNKDASGFTADYLIIKINSNGDKQWGKVLGGTEEDVAECVIQTADNGYLIVGHTYSNNGDVSGNHNPDADGEDIWIVKLDVNGTVTWKKTLGGTGDDLAFSVVQANDGHYVLTGSSTSANGDIPANKGLSDLWVAKLNSTGTALLWQFNYGGSGLDAGTAIAKTTDNGYIISGNTSSPTGNGNITTQLGGGDAWVVKISPAGALEWEKTYGGNSIDQGNSIQQTTDGGYILGAFTNSRGIGGNILVVKIAADRSTEWDKSLGGNGSDVPYAVLETNDGKYLVGGRSNSQNAELMGLNKGGFDAWLVKLSTTAVTPTFTFNGNGNWNVPANWAGGVVPTSPVAAGTKVIISPATGGQCILNVPVTFLTGSELTVSPNAVFRISGNLTVEKD